MTAARALAVVSLVAGAAGPAAAQPVDDTRGSAGVASYSDGLDTVIWTPFVGAGATLPALVDLDVHWTADVISSASVDVITAATPKMDEIRNELGVAASRERLFADVDLSGSYTYSIERDADAHTIQTAARRGFYQDNVELALSYALSRTRLGVKDEPSSAWRPLWIHSVDVTGSYVINPRTIAELVYSTFYSDGYHANPYRRVPILMGEDLRSANWVDERVPDTRWRNALTARGRRAIGSSWVAAAQYRLYRDDWGVLAHTVRAEGSVELLDGLNLRFTQRTSIQSAADFYEESYTSMPEYRTRDRRLSDHLSLMGGAAMTWSVGKIGSIGTLELRLSGDALAWDFSEFGGPELDAQGGAELVPLGWIYGTIVQFGLELRP